MPQNAIDRELCLRITTGTTTLIQLEKAYFRLRFADEQYSLNAALLLAKKERGIERGVAWCLNVSCNRRLIQGMIMPKRKRNTVAVHIDSAICVIREQRVILDTDLARGYGIPTFRLNEAVKLQ